MKVGVWHDLHSGGGKRALHNHVSGLVAAGHEVEVADRLGSHGRTIVQNEWGHDAAAGRFVEKVEQVVAGRR